MESGSRRLLRGCLIRVGKLLPALSLSSQLDIFWLTVTDSMISYPNYKFIFPVKTLGMFQKRFGDVKIF